MTNVKHLGVRHVGILTAVDKLTVPTLGVDIGLGLTLLIEVGGILLSFLDTNLVLYSTLLGQQIVMTIAVIGGRLHILGRNAKRKKGHRRQGDIKSFYTHYKVNFLSHLFLRTAKITHLFCKRRHLVC